MRFINQGILTAAALSAFIAAPSDAALALGACSILSRDEVKPFAGGSPLFDMLPPEEEPSGRGSACNYGRGIIYMQIDPFPFATIDAERAKPGAKFEAIPGVGDVAYARENTSSDDAELYFRAGQRVVTIQMNIATGQTYDSVKPRLVGLGRALATKLR